MKNKHLTDSERRLIEDWLHEGTSLKKIAERLGKATSTISREIRTHAQPSDKFAPHRIHNRCAFRKDCQRRYLCLDKPDCTRRCASCHSCNQFCNDYQEEVCWRLSEPPYTCNGCLDEHLCVLRKRYYLHKKAHEAYREMLIESRTGANITQDELLTLDTFISPLIRRGQSIHHIVSNNKDEFNVSEKTLYRYVDGGLLYAKNIDMPRVCRMKPRKSKPVQHKVDSACRVRRTYTDFQNFIQKRDVAVVEIDSVIGRVGGKVLLTMLFKSCDFMLAFLRDKNTSQSVIDIFNDLYDRLGTEHFRKLFPALLADNGSEFSNPKALEFDAQGMHRTNVFFCDPCASFQKPNVELNHEFIRRILPKKTSFDLLAQIDIDLMMAHINSYSREKLMDKSPHDLFQILYGEEILAALGLTKIPANEILLKPSLFKK